MTRGADSTLSEMLRGIDVFQGVSRELAHAGGADWKGRIFFMLLGYAVIAALSVFEIRSFTSSTWTTDTVVNSHMNEAITVQFDFTVPNVPCGQLRMGSRDAFGISGAFGISNTVQLRPLDHNGNTKSDGKFIKDEHLDQWSNQMLQLRPWEQTDLSFWNGQLTSAEFSRKNISEVTSSRDFTLVYFYADWDFHSHFFHPSWDRLVDTVSDKMQFPTPSGQAQKVTLLKMNCADFRETCREESIKTFPSLRMYRRDGTFVSYNYKQERTVDGVTRFLSDYFNGHVHEEAVAWGGCQASGVVNVPRVQGNFHLSVGYNKDYTPNPDLVNMSVIVNHLAFQDASANFRTIDRLGQLNAENVPTSITDHITPLDGKEFIVEQEGLIPEHFLKVVNTKIGSKKDFYQITHTVKTARPEDITTERAAPLARFSYDFSPLRVVLQKHNKPWYDFLTSLVAIIGGTYAIVQTCGGTVDKIYLARKASGKHL